MTTERQKELIEEHVAQLPPLPYGCPRRTQAIAQGSLASASASASAAEAAAAEEMPLTTTSEQRDRRVRLAPSTLLPPLTAVYIDRRRSHAGAAIGKRFVSVQTTGATA